MITAPQLKLMADETITLVKGTPHHHFMPKLILIREKCGLAVREAAHGNPRTKTGQSTAPHELPEGFDPNTVPAPSDLVDQLEAIVQQIQ